MKISAIASLVVAALGAALPAGAVVAQCDDIGRCDPGSVRSVKCSSSDSANEMCSEAPTELISLKTISPAASRSTTASNEARAAASPVATPAPEPGSGTLTLLAMGLLMLLGLRRYVRLRR